jgi:hypothetical protein
VIWTRHRRPPDLTPAVRNWFAGSGFEELSFDTDLEVPFGVGTHKLVGEPQPYGRGIRLFTFTERLPDQTEDHPSNRR